MAIQTLNHQIAIRALQLNIITRSQFDRVRHGKCVYVIGRGQCSSAMIQQIIEEGNHVDAQSDKS